MLVLKQPTGVAGTIAPWNFPASIRPVAGDDGSAGLTFHQQDCNHVFIVKSETKDAVTLTAEATLSHALKPFIRRSNSRIAVWNKAAAERARQLAQQDD
ncbi:hypothetical protein [Mesorhizobium sp. RIZ17]|uniref:hypothetical protein n=1 Tax=Mesorhizobium sp. RIZ17 TaxID=3132743 RepID=UPI003DA8F2FA